MSSREAKTKSVSEIRRLRNSEKRVKCPFCPFKTATNQSLGVHLFIHTGEKPLACDFPECGFETASEQGLKWHKRRHENKRELKCPFCAYGANCMNSYKAHLVIHTKERNWACPLCEHRTTQKSHLTIHLRTHTGEKPYKCSFCPYAAADKRNLKSHEYIHSDLKPFACNLCSYKSRQKSHLNEHLKRHFAEKAYKCDHCHYKSVDASSLNRHLDVHSNLEEKPEKCLVPECKYVVSSCHLLKRHLKSKHKWTLDKIHMEIQNSFPKQQQQEKLGKEEIPKENPQVTVEIYKCPQNNCGFSTSQNDQLALHLNEHKLPRIILHKI